MISAERIGRKLFLLYNGVRTNPVAGSPERTVNCMDEQKLRKKNYASMLAEGGFFFAGLSFIDANAVVPVFIFAYTQSVLLAGLAATINFAASIILQTLVGPYVKGIRNVPRYICLIMFIFRPLPLLMVPILFLNLSPWFTTGIFLVLYGLFFAGDGLIVIPWIDLFSRTIESGKRGLLLGNQQVLGGIGALLAGSVVKATLDSPLLNNDQKFAIIFGAAAMVMILASIAQAFSRDLPHKVTQEKPNPLRYYRQIPAHIRSNPLFAKIALTRVLSIIAAMVAPFVILFCQDLLSLEQKEVSTLILIQIIGSLLGGFLWGKISHRLGNHRVILISQSLGLLLALSVILLALLPHVAMPAFLLWPLVLINGINMAAWIGFVNYTIDIVHAEERTVYMLIGNLMTFPFVFLAFLAGIIAQAFGYAPIFVISALAAGMAVIRATRLKAPPLQPETPLLEATED